MDKRYTVDATVKACIAKYPMLFQSRTEVLHHVLMVLGNGFEWVDGQLVEKYGMYSRPDRIPVDVVDLRSKTVVKLSMHYPLSEESNINTFPENTQPDWRSAIDELLEATKDAKPF